MYRIDRSYLGMIERGEINATPEMISKMTGSRNFSLWWIYF